MGRRGQVARLYNASMDRRSAFRALVLGAAVTVLLLGAGPTGAATYQAHDTLYIIADPGARAEAVLAGLTTHASLAVDVYYWLGMSQVARQSWKQGAETFAAGAAIDAKHRLNETLTYHTARALLQDGQLQAATEKFDDLLRKWPDSAVADESWLGKLQAARKSVAEGKR